MIILCLFIIGLDKQTLFLHHKPTLNFMYHNTYSYTLGINIQHTKSK